MKKILLGAALALSLAGCATTTSISDAETEVSAFDGSKKVSVTPNDFKCTDTYTTCANIGFVWLDKFPDEASVLVEITDYATAGDYHAISAIKFNIDGEITSLDPFPTSQNDFDNNGHSRFTRRVYVAPLSLLQKIKTSGNTKAQIIAKGAIIEGDFKSSGNSTKSYYSMLRFLEQVEANK